MVALCITVMVVIPSCGKDVSTPDELNENLVSQTETLEDENTEQSEDVPTEKEDNTTTENDETDNSTDEEQDLDAATEGQDQEINTTSEEKEEVASENNQKTEKDSLNSAQNSNFEQPSDNQPVYPISEETKTYIDIFGIQTIEKKYVVPYYADIRDIAPATITTNYVQYAVDSIVSPQNYEEKKLTKEIIAKTEDEADNFPTELEYDDTDGKGMLTLDTDSVKVELNKNEKIPSATSFVKTYDMAIKDQDKIPQTIKSNGITYRQGKVTWTNMGDPGTGINGTEGNNGYGTYNTVASSWRATVSYIGTKYTEDKDYKGTATYVGKILMKNSPTNTYVVTYKPNATVANSSGIYYNNYVNSIYSKENSKLAATNPTNVMDLYSSGTPAKMPTIMFLLPWGLLYLLAIGVACVAFKVWKRVNSEEPEESVAAAVTEGDISLDMDKEMDNEDEKMNSSM